MEVLRRLDYGTYAFFSHQFKPETAAFKLCEPLTFLGTFWVVTAVAAAAMVISLASKRFRSAVAISVCFLAAVGLTEGLNLRTERSRPSDSQRHVSREDFGKSFPAREVLLSTYSWLALVVALWPVASRKLVGVGFFSLSLVAILAVCMVQLILSLHFLTDVLAGLAGGAALALLAKHFGTQSVRPA